jgi:hypothetical protein
MNNNMNCFHFPVLAHLPSWKSVLLHGLYEPGPGVLLLIPKVSLTALPNDLTPEFLCLLNVYFPSLVRVVPNFSS